MRKMSPTPTSRRATSNTWKTMQKIHLCLIALVLCAPASAQPVVTNVQASQRPGTKFVDIYYSVANASGPVYVSIAVSDDGGATYAVPASSFSRDVGPGVLPGSNKRAVWDAGADWNGQYSENMRFRITAYALMEIEVSFEPDASGHLPDGSLASDNLPLTDQYLTQGIRFGFDNDLNGEIDATGSPTLEQIGYDGTDCFWNNYLYDSTGSLESSLDLAFTGYADQLGNYFMKSAEAGSPPNTICIVFDAPIKSFSGEIWDLDGNLDQGRFEKWRIEALNESKVVIGYMESPLGLDVYDPNTLDGKPWPFTFDLSAFEPVWGIRLVSIGQTGETGDAPVAFNNLKITYTVIP